MRRVRWRLLPFLALLYVVAYLDRVNISFAKLTMSGAIGIDDEAYAFGAGIFFIGYFLFEVPSNVILERVGARRWIARILVTWGLISSATAFVTGPASFVGMRFLLGVAEAGFFPGILLYLTYWFPSATRASVVGWLMVALPVSGLIGSPLSGELMRLNGWGLQGWQWMLLVEGLPAFVLGFVCLRVLPDGPTDAKWLPPDEREWLTAALDSHADKPALISVHHHPVWPKNDPNFKNGGITEGKIVACLGPIVAKGATEAGIHVDTVATDFTSDGLAKALAEFYASARS